MAEVNFPMPNDKYYVDCATALVALGWEKVKPSIPQILEWMKDINWPVAKVFQPFLMDAGAHLAPFLMPIFAGNDDTWKYHVLADIVSQSPELAGALNAELNRLASFPTDGERIEGVWGQARDILA